MARVTRRDALRTGLVTVGGLAAASAFPALHWLAPSALNARTSGRVLTYELFAAQLGTQFRVSSQSLPATQLRLASVERLLPVPHPRQPRPSGDGFVVRFEGAASIPSATYEVEHGRLGRFGMFLSPVGLPGPVSTFEAVFNRLWS